jgi:hypothetical protein
MICYPKAMQSLRTFMKTIYEAKEIIYFISVCSFLKSCVQFLVKCVQFPKVLCSVSGEAKGRRAYRTHVSHLSKGRHTLWRRVSLLLNIHKKRKHTYYSPQECSLHQHVACLFVRIRQTYVYQRASSGPAQEAPRGAQAV